VRPYLENTQHKKSAGGVAQSVGPEFKSQYWKGGKKGKERDKERKRKRKRKRMRERERESSYKN
jgi:hypothetical protein